MAIPSEQHIWWLRRVKRRMKKMTDKETPMPADPAAVPPPEWAVEMAVSYSRPRSGEVDIDAIARLLASVREGAIHDSIAAVWAASKTGDDPVVFINQILHTPPSGGGAG